MIKQFRVWHNLSGSFPVSGSAWCSPSLLAYQQRMPTKSRGEKNIFNCSTTIKRAARTKQDAKDKCGCLVLRRKPSVHNIHWSSTKKPCKFNFNTIPNHSFLPRVQARPSLSLSGEGNKYNTTSVVSISFLHVGHDTNFFTEANSETSPGHKIKAPRPPLCTL